LKYGTIGRHTDVDPADLHVAEVEAPGIEARVELRDDAHFVGGGRRPGRIGETDRVRKLHPRGYILFRAEPLRTADRGRTLRLRRLLE